MNIQTYTRPSGKDIKVNDTEATRALALANGWEPKGKPKAKKEAKEE